MPRPSTAELAGGDAALGVLLPPSPTSMSRRRRAAARCGAPPWWSGGEGEGGEWHGEVSACTLRSTWQRRGRSASGTP
eukprot:365981-Chlamydomonas_euryale.AAC.10